MLYGGVGVVWGERTVTLYVLALWGELMYSCLRAACRKTLHALRIREKY